MDSKDDVHDPDSGIVQVPGPYDLSTMMDINTHAQVVELKRQSLHDRLELCILELRKLCIREAELTGHLPHDYPLMPGEKSPQIRRRIGAAFKLDEQSIKLRGQDSELTSAEAKLALQQQIYVATCKLCQEEHLSKAVKKSRLQQCKREEQKLKELQETVCRLKQGRTLLHPSMITQQYQSTSDDSLLSVSEVMEKDKLTSQFSRPTSPVAERHSGAPLPSHHPLTHRGILLHPPERSHSPHQLSPEHVQPSRSNRPEYGPAFIQSPHFKESGLNHPYLRLTSHSNSASSSPVTTPVLPRREICLDEADLMLQIPPHTGRRHTPSNSTPSTPEMKLRRGQYPSVPSSGNPNNAEREKGLIQSPQICLAPEHPPMMSPVGNPAYHSKNSSSEYSSASSCIRSTFREFPTEPEWQCQPQYPRYQYANHPVSPSYIPLNYHRNTTAQFSQNAYRGHIDEGRNYDLNMRRIYGRHHPAPPYNNDQYWGYDNYWYEETPLHQQGCRLIPQHVNYPNMWAPSLREYPQHPRSASHTRWFQNQSSRGMSAASCTYPSRGPWARVQ